MIGRYGFDKLGFALVTLGFIINVITSFLRIFSFGLIYSNRTVYVIFLIISYACYIPFAVALFRALSRNTEKRRSENLAFMKIAGRWVFYFAKKLRQKKDVNHRYFNCPSCHRTLRVPKGRGKIKIDCPHCSRQFTKRT